MKKFQFIAGIVSLVIGLAFALFNLLKIEGIFENTTINVYPAAFFGLLGLLLLYRAIFKQPGG